MTRRAGATLAEMLLVFALFALVLTALGGFVAAQRGIAATQRDRVRATEAVRTAAVVLSSELRSLARADIVHGRDSLRIRAMRGGGVVCGGSPSEPVLRYSGLRLPDPAKDSLLLVRSGAPDTVRAVTGVAVDPTCPGGVRISLDGPVPTRGLALVFETGTYHLGERMLRYRRGAGGRQPVTEPIFDSAWLDPVPDGFRLRMELDADTLRHLSNLRHSVLLHMLNGDLP